MCAIDYYKDSGVAFRFNRTFFLNLNSSIFDIQHNFLKVFNEAEVVSKLLHNHKIKFGFSFAVFIFLCFYHLSFTLILIICHVCEMGHSHHKTYFVKYFA